MLSKTLTGTEILEIVHKHLKDSGLTIVKNKGDRIGLSTSNTISFEVEMTPVKQAPLHFPEGVRTPFPGPNVGGRGILDNQTIVCTDRDSTSYIQRGPSKMRATFDATDPDLKVGLTS